MTGTSKTQQGGGRRTAWCEKFNTKARDIKTLLEAFQLEDQRPWTVDVDLAGRPRWSEDAKEIFGKSICKHLDEAEKAASFKKRRFRFTGARLESAMDSLDSAEADLLQLAPADYVIGQMPSIVNHVDRHLPPTDLRRLEVEQFAKQLQAVAHGSDRVNDGPRVGRAKITQAERDIVNEERGTIVGAVRGASSAAVGEQTRVRNFRNVVGWTAFGMLLLAVGLVVIGIRSPTSVPLCFAPETAKEVTVVCPTEQSGPIPPRGDPPEVTATDINNTISQTAHEVDIFVVAVIGAAAAAVAAAAAIKRIRCSSEPYGVPTALAVLKLPTGAVTAVLGLVLMRGGFIPGLSALDSSAQILAWAAIFGYAQQLFTRLVDQQANAVLDNVRGGDTTIQAPPGT